MSGKHKTSMCIALYCSIFCIPLSKAAVNFGSFSTAFPSSSNTPTSTNPRTFVGSSTFEDDVSGANGFVRVTYTGAFGGTEYTEFNSRWFNNNPATDSFTARNGTWEIAFFEDAAFTTPTSITGFTVGLTHLNDLRAGGRYVDYFHDFAINGVETQPDSTNLVSNHFYDAQLNALGGSNTGTTSLGTSTITYNNPVSVFTMTAGSVAADGSFGGTPTGNTFDVGTNPGYGTIGVNLGVLTGTAVVPEPNSALLLLLGSFITFCRRRR